MSLNWFLYNKWNFFLNIEGNLNLNWFNFSFMDFYLLVLYSISISLNRNLSNDLIRNQFFYLNFNRFLNFHLDLNQFFNLNCFVLGFFDNNRFFNRNLDWYFNSLNFNLRNRNFNNLQLMNSLNDYLFNNFRNFNNLLNYSWNRHYLLNYFLNFNDSWHFNYLLNNSVDKLRLNLHNLLLNNHRNWLLYFHRLHYFLFGCHNLHLLNFQFFDSVSNIRNLNFCKNRQLFLDIKWHNLLFLNVFGNKNFLNNWLINKYLNFFDLFLFISFDEMRSVNIYFLCYFSHQLFLNFQLYFY